jgi:glycine/D-amino acid oxidase-like deaminating enzyme
MSEDVIIVGGGLFGMIAAQAVRTRLGIDPIIVHDDRPLMGSKAAACLMADGWLSSMSLENRTTAFTLLDQVYRMRTLRFQVRVGPLEVKLQDVKWVDPLHILYPKGEWRKMQATVESIEQVGNTVQLMLDDGKTRLVGDRCIIAAGHWTEKLFPGAATVAKGGWAHRWKTSLPLDPPGRPITDGFIKTWAPYKQIVAFEIEPERLWVGDGSALLLPSMTRERLEASRARCAEAAEQPESLAQTIAGIRPYAAAKTAEPCLLLRRDRITAITGGAKNGTVAAAWAAATYCKQFNW